MASNPDIDHLIILYLTNNATANQKAELQAWVNESKANKAVFEHLTAIWREHTPVADNESMRRRRENIWKAGTRTAEDQKGRREYGIRHFMAIAATLLIILMSVWVAIDRTAGPPDAVALVEKHSLAGERSMHILPDGTEVWLNAESTLRYPENFSDSIRQVYLMGEAFFDVAHDKSKPFIVEAAGTATEALGTAFDVRAFEADDIIQVALLEGRVRVKEHATQRFALLSPGEQLLISKDGQQFTVRQFSQEESVGWKDGILVFDGDDFETFCSIVERTYGVHITVIGSPADNWSIRARYANERLSTVLRDISFAKRFTFELRNKELIINFNVKPMI